MAEEKPPVDSPEAAMNVVLAAEQTARDAIELCRREAEQALDAARGRAREILARTDRRIARLHESRAAAVQRQVAAILAEEERIRAHFALQANTNELLDQAAARLAELLTTAAERPEVDENPL